MLTNGRAAKPKAHLINRQWVLVRRVRAVVASRSLLGPIVCSLALAPLAGAADFDQALREASAKVMELQPQLEQMATEGRIKEGNEQLLAVFPQAKRSAVQALVLGNVLYGMDAKLSYALYQEAALKEPHEQRVLLEWAMEQHRAGEMAAALAAYDEYAERDPEFAPAHGLAADCLIRLNRVAEAKARWRRSEDARRGSLETFETLVCEVYKDPSLHQKCSNWNNRPGRRPAMRASPLAT